MNDNNGFPPSNDFPPAGNENPGMPPQQPSAPMPPASGYSQPPVSAGSISGVSKLLIGMIAMLGIMVLIVPMGLFKIGSPTACSGERAKNGECKVISTPAACTPKRFSQESEYLTCKMVGAFSEKFKADHPSKYESCMSLKSKIAVGEDKEDFKCYAPVALLKMKSGKGKLLNPANLPPLEVQKMSVLNSLSPSTLTADFIFTLLTIAVLVFIMGIAAYMAHKKNKDSFMYVAGVFLIGILASYVYRYYVAGFYQSNIVVLIVSLVGAIPLVAIVMSAAGKLGKSIGSIDEPGNYVLAPETPQEPLPTEPLSPAETTKFEKMGLQNSSPAQVVFVLSFIALVLTLIPIGLLSMGKTSKADSAMKKEAIKMTSLAKKQANETSEDVDMGEEEEPEEDM